MIQKKSLFLLCTLLGASLVSAAKKPNKKAKGKAQGLVATGRFQEKIKASRAKALTREAGFLEPALHFKPAQAIKPTNSKVVHPAGANLPSNDVHSICANSAANIENFRCYADEDCYYYQSLHATEATVFSEDYKVWGDRNDQWECQNNKCFQYATQGAEGDFCTSGNYEVRGFSECQDPFTCSSNRCQRPLAAGCGNCTDDIGSCMPGTVCNDQTNTCTARLQEGSRCVYQVQTLWTYFDGSEDQYYPMWLDRVLPCDASGTDRSNYDRTLFCDIDGTQTCVRKDLSTPYGHHCDWNKYDGGCAGYCDDRGVCAPLGMLNDDCSNKPCDENLQCRYSNRDNTYFCAQYYSAEEGDACTSEECGPGLYCDKKSYSCKPTKASWEACTADDGQCSGLDTCTNGVCIPIATGGEGDYCFPGFDTWAVSTCASGYICDKDTSTCQKVDGAECSVDNDCAAGPHHGEFCSCNTALSKPGLSYGNATCYQAHNEDATNAIFTKVNTCMKEVGMNTGMTFQLLEAYRPEVYNQIICCLLCGTSDEEFRNPYFTVDYVSSVFGRDVNRLHCSGESSIPDDFCLSGADYSLYGLKTLAQCPGYGSYSGVYAPPRHVEFPSGEAAVACGNSMCSGNGICSDDETYCICNTNAWGDSCQYTESSRDTDRQFLQDLWESTNGALWINNDGFVDYANVWFYVGDYEYCNWPGLTCDEDRFLTSIVLADNNLQGTIPESVGALTRIENIQLSGNMLIGEVPAGLWKLETLRVVDLSFNALSGQLPEYINEHLQALILNNNQFSGPLPLSLGLLGGNLHIVHLQTNNFNGTLPPTIVNLPNVTSWDLTSNNFERGEFLPEPLCSFCDRVYTPCNVSHCNDDCVDGFLMACTSPRAFQIQRSKSEFDCKPVASMRRILDTVQEQCVYRFD